MDLYGSVTLRVYKCILYTLRVKITLNLQYKLWVPGIEMPLNGDSIDKCVSNSVIARHSVARYELCRSAMAPNTTQ